MDHDARIEKINDSYVVRIGAYQVKNKALSLLKQLKLTYTDAFIIKYVIDKRQIVKGMIRLINKKGKKRSLSIIVKSQGKTSGTPDTNARSRPHIDNG